MPTHGSLTKAGKVRSQTPKITTQKKKHLRPMARNVRNHQRRILSPRKERRRF